MTKPYIRLPWLFLLLSCGLWLHSFPSLGQHYAFESWSIGEGLPRAGVYSLLEDRYGFLWVATEGGGVTNFDGNQFHSFNQAHGLAGNVVRTIFEDREGNLWFGTQGNGVSRYDRKQFFNYSIDEGLSGSYVRTITQDSSGGLWFGTSGQGLCRMVGPPEAPEFSYFTKEDGLAHNRVRASLCDSKGRLWFGTDGGLCQYTGEGFKVWKTSDGLPHNKILSLFEDEAGNLWLGTEWGAVRFDGATFEILNEASGLINNRVRTITQDKQGHIWFGTKAGISEYDGIRFAHYTEKNGLSNDRIRSVLTDSEGNLWIGTYFGGICRFNGTRIIHFAQEDGLRNHQVQCLFSDTNESILVGTLRGVAQLSQPDDKSPFIAYPYPELRDREVYAIVRSPDNILWIGTDYGLFGFQGKKRYSLSSNNGLINPVINALAADTGGWMWAGTARGLCHFKFDPNNPDSVVSENTTVQDGLAGEEVSSLYLDHLNRLWVGFKNGGISLLEKGKVQPHPFPKEAQNITHIVGGPQNSIWVSTAGHGLFWSSALLDGFKVLRQEQGISSNNVQLMVFQSDSLVWLGNELGLDRVAISPDFLPTSCYNFDNEEGFAGIETTTGTVISDQKGKLWFGTIQGVFGIDPKLGDQDAAPPFIHLSGVRLGPDPVNWKDNKYAKGVVGPFGLPSKLVLPASEKHLTFDFIGLSLGAPQKLHYRWKLEGFEDDWNEQLNLSEISYTNLPAGNYTFLITAANGRSGYNPQPEVFHFRVLPPYWQTWWFISAAILLGVGLSLLVLKLRERQLLRERRILTQKVDERTAEVVRQKEEIALEKQKSDQLLLNILPFETAEELKEKGVARVKKYKLVSVLFTDFVGFTRISEKLSSEELVVKLDSFFRMFDEIIEHYELEKIKTIGDAYMCAGGIPVADETNPVRMVLAAFEIQTRMQTLNQQTDQKGETPWQLRIGINTGPVITGVVGKRKFAYDLWGDTVNVASRMESGGGAGQINVSGSTYLAIEKWFYCKHRGQLEAKNKGKIDMYFVDRLKEKWSKDADGKVPNEEMLQAFGLSSYVSSPISSKGSSRKVVS